MIFEEDLRNVLKKHEGNIITEELIDSIIRETRIGYVDVGDLYKE